MTRAPSTISGTSQCPCSTARNRLSAQNGGSAASRDPEATICLAPAPPITDTPPQFGRPIDPAETAETVLRCFAPTRHVYLARLTFPDIGRDCLGFTCVSSPAADANLQCLPGTW